METLTNILEGFRPCAQSLGLGVYVGAAIHQVAVGAKKIMTHNSYVDECKNKLNIAGGAIAGVCTAAYNYSNFAGQPNDSVMDNVLLYSGLIAGGAFFGAVTRPIVRAFAIRGTEMNRDNMKTGAKIGAFAVPVSYIAVDIITSFAGKNL